MEEILQDKLFVPICMQKEVYFIYSSFCVAVNELSMLTSFQAWIYFGFRPATVWRQVWQAWGLGGVRRPRFGCISRLLSLLWLLALSKLTPPRVYGQSSRKSQFVSRIWDIFQPSRRLLGALVGFYFGRVFVCLYVERPRTFLGSHRNWWWWKNYQVSIPGILKLNTQRHDSAVMEKSILWMALG